MNRPEKLTRNQSLVLDALGRADGPLSAYTILDRLREDGLRAPLQVYRALDRLLEHGLVHRLESINSFVACGGPHCHRAGATVAFAICDKCRRVSEFVDEGVRQGLADWTQAHGFRPASTIIEIRGTCASCQAAA